MPDRVCPTCGETFDPVVACRSSTGAVARRTHHLRKFCSPKCHASRQRQKQAPPKQADPRHSAAVRKRLENRDAGREQGCDPATCEREYDDDELEFLKAVDRYRREKRRPFPTACEILAVAVSVGYRKVAPPTAG